MIKEGDKLPEATFNTITKDGPRKLTTQEIFGGKKVALFAVPGAFTPTCSAQHLPGFLANKNALKKKGVDAIACVSVNDAFVMDAWGKERKVGDDILMLADGNGEFAKKLGVELDASGFGLGTRSKRYAMLVDNGVVKQFNLDEKGFEKSKAEVILERM